MYVLVLNLGLKSIRAIIFDTDGNKMASYSTPIDTSIRGSWVEQNPEEWWDKGCDVIMKAIVDKDLRNGIRYITVTSSSACLVPVGKDGNVLRWAIMVSDRRAIKQSKYLSGLEEFKPVTEKTGLKADPYLMLPKIIWLKENEKEIFAQAYKYLSPNDYLIFRLTGTYHTDFFNAQKFYYDILSYQYPNELLRRIDVNIETLPLPVSPGTNVGRLKKEIVEKFRFRENIECVVSTYDAICAFLGSGPSGPGESCDVSGTVTSLRTFSNKLVSNHLDRLIITPFLPQDLYIIGGSNNLGGGLIEWIKQCLYEREEYPYEVMEKEAKESTLGAKGLIFLPYLMGERTPIWDPYARGVFFGIERFHKRGDFTRAVFESVGFGLQSILEVIEEQDIEVKEIRTSGGLARIGFISQLKGDITGKNILVIDEFETTSLGALILVGLGTKIYRDLREASQRLVKIREIIRPNPNSHVKYAQIFELYQKTYQRLKKLFVERAQLLDKIFREKEERIENL